MANLKFSNLDPWLRFSLQFAALVIISEVIYYGWLLDSAPMQDYLAWTARLSGRILGIIGQEVTIHGNTVSGSRWAVKISSEWAPIAGAVPDPENDPLARGGGIDRPTRRSHLVRRRY